MQPELCLLVIKTRQLEVMKAFYQKLGLSFTEEQHGNGPVHYSSSTGSLLMEIYPLPKSVEVADTTTRLGFSVSNVDEVLKVLASDNVQIVTGPVSNEWGYTAVVKDPDGRMVELVGDCMFISR